MCEFDLVFIPYVFLTWCNDWLYIIFPHGMNEGIVLIYVYLRMCIYVYYLLHFLLRLLSLNFAFDTLWFCEFAICCVLALFSISFSFGSSLVQFMIQEQTRYSSREGSVVSDTSQRSTRGTSGSAAPALIAGTEIPRDELYHPPVLSPPHSQPPTKKSSQTSTLPQALPAGVASTSSNVIDFNAIVQKAIQQAVTQQVATQMSSATVVSRPTSILRKRT